MDRLSLKISVLMSLYYKENPKYLREAIESILSQSYIPDQFVIVKDGRLTDELEEVLNDYKNNGIFKIIGYDNNCGLGHALNYGVVNCDGDIIVRMDSDDISAKDRIEKQLKYIVEYDYDFVGSNTIEFTNSIENIQGRRIMPENSTDIYNYSKTRNPFIHPSIMTYKNVLLESGNYQDCYLCEDFDMWIRVLKKGYKCYNIQENLVYMRVNDDFYRRRGGLKYCKSILSFLKKIRKQKWMGFFDYHKRRVATIVVSMVPSNIRVYIYKKFLRG